MIKRRGCPDRKTALTNWIVRYFITMKKCLSGLLALILTVTLCAGCGEKQTEQQPPSGIYYEVTGLDPRSTAYKVGDVEFPVDMYLYWIAYSCSSLEYNLNMYHMMYADVYNEMFDADGNLLWNAEFMDGMTLSEYAKQQARDNLLFYAAIENKVQEFGVELDGEDTAQMESELADTIESMGGQEAFDENLEIMGISRESFDRIAADAQLFQKMVDLMQEESSPLYKAPEEYEEFASYADHILLSLTDAETDEPLSEEEAAERYSTAQDLLAQLQNAEDVETLFNQLADEYSEDPGRAAGKGYLVTPDSNFVEGFLNTALELSPGEVSDIVETDFGYHILYRRHLADVQEQVDLSLLAQDYLYTQIDADMDRLSLEGSEEIDAIDAGEFYSSYNAKVEEITAAKEAENTDDSTDSADSTDNADNTDDTAGNGEE